ncbi:hypothetical protein PR048_013612 [Dryococelus australis]|uniref:Uncharacterized protein n=1 Tax=Dryococelus australis TaxID=614101 RepID=A0ABQ9HSP2_9NEOP|nr:hypothetical protein PR048_013612 [Dryococelus australis]
MDYLKSSFNGEFYQDVLSSKQGNGSSNNRDSKFEDDDADRVTLFGGILLMTPAPIPSLEDVAWLEAVPSFNIGYFDTGSSANNLCNESLVLSGKLVCTSKEGEDLHSLEFCDTNYHSEMVIKVGFPVVCKTNDFMPEILEKWCEVTTVLCCEEVCFDDLVKRDSALAICPSTENQSEATGITTSVEEETTVSE